MKTTLSLLAFVGIIGANVFGLSLSGSWSTEIDILPTLGLNRSVVELVYATAGWEITSTSAFMATGFTSQKFGISGALGFVDIGGSMSFSPMPVTFRSLSYVIPDSWSGLGYDLTIQDDKWAIDGPHFQEAAFTASMNLLGVELGLGVSLEANKYVALDATGVVGTFLFYLDIPSYVLGPEDMTLVSHPTVAPLAITASAKYSTYFATDHIRMTATTVTFEGEDADTGLPVTHTLTGAFEVYSFDADTETVILTLGADMYLWYYIAEYAAANDWEDWPISYEIDVEDLEVSFLFPSYMLYTLDVGADPFSASLTMVDACRGIHFHSALFGIADVDLCCGVTFDFELSFLKWGFDYAKFTFSDLFSIMGYWTYDVIITYGVDKKTVLLDWDFVFPLDVCLELFVASDGLFDLTLEGFRIKCELHECNYVEFTTYFDAAYAPDAWKAGEFERIGLGFCGPGCCGDEYKVNLAMYFDDGGQLFGMSRFLSDFSVPLMENFALEAVFGYTLATAATEMSFGWTFTF